jgi:hypothetical protein
MHRRRIRIEPLGALLAEAHLQLRRERVAPEIIGKGAAEAAYAGKLAAPLGDQLVFLGGGRLLGIHA